MRTWKRWLSAIRPYEPMHGGRELLDNQYAKGSWDYLRDIHEAPRFSIVAGYCQYLRPDGSILEIGCGEGILQERLCPSRYSRYTGVDLSLEAIQRAQHKARETVCFVAEDAATFTPEARFDVIVFNECLEYFDDPLSLVRRYEAFLDAGGVFIVSMFEGIETVRTQGIWKQLDAVYPVRAIARVGTQPRHSWIIKVLVPTG